MSGRGDVGKAAALAEVREDGAAICGLCPHRCVVKPGAWGRCKTRTNRNGVLEAASYGRLIASAMDPVEKKPLFHFRPGSQTFSIASAGCNLRCQFCQNHRISQTEGHWQFEAERYVTPAEIVQTASSLGADSISFTYSEPLLMFELARDAAPLAAAEGIDLIFVTNGQASAQAASALSSILRAANVDIKGFSAERYRTDLGGSLSHTLDTVACWVNAGVWVEVTTLLIPGFNDSEAELREIARFIASLDRSIPWHISRYHPAHRSSAPGVTPADRIRAAREIGLAEGLSFVYTGNMPGDGGETTCCPACKTPVIERLGFEVLRVSVRDGRCENCGETIAGVGMP